MSCRTSMSEEELKWQRRSDARTLAEAEQIKADKERYAGAIKGAKEIANEEIARVKGIAKVAGVKTPNIPKEDNKPESTAFNKRGYVNPATLGRF